MEIVKSIGCSHNLTTKIFAKSSDTDVATVKINKDDKYSVQVTALKAGTCTITIDAPDDGIHSPIVPKQCIVKIMEKESISTEWMLEKIRAGQAKNAFAVGDIWPVELTGPLLYVDVAKTWYACVLDIDHNSKVEGTNTVTLQMPHDANGDGLVFIESGATRPEGYVGSFYMNNSYTNAGGWKSSYMRNTLMPAFVDIISSKWSGMIKDTTRYYDNVGGASNVESNITTVVDKAWLGGSYEVAATNRHFEGSWSSGYMTVDANSSLYSYQATYKYYMNSSVRIRYGHTEEKRGNAWTWWTSTPYNNYNNSYGSKPYPGQQTSGFFRMGSNGVPYYSYLSYGSNDSLGVAPIFNIG